MEIKEVEKLLSVSRSNIRFYEKEGLLRPERGENNYRNYSEDDIAMLKKIIVLRKLGFSIEEIAAMQKGELLLSDAVQENIKRLEAEIEKLRGALETAKNISSEQATFETLDERRYWDAIAQAETDGKEFADICKDYLLFERDTFDRVWKYVFFYDFKESRQRYGVWKAVGILLLFCLARGLGRKFIWQGSFWEGFLYPMGVFIAVSLLQLPLYILRRVAPKAAEVVTTVLVVLIGAFCFFDPADFVWNDKICFCINQKACRAASLFYIILPRRSGLR